MLEPQKTAGVQSRSFGDLMKIKSDARDKQVRAVYAAEPSALDLAAQHLKAVLRGNSASIARPRRFSSL